MKISVIIPCYNAAHTLTQCVNSALHQTYLVHEIVLVDDGSTDQTKAVAQTLIEQHPEKTIIYRYQENAGPSKARNTGMQLSTGDWIAFLDADDYWMPKKLETQYAFLQQHPQCEICSTANSKLFMAQEATHQIITLKKLLYRNFFETSTVLVRASAIKNIGFNEKQNYSEDYRAWLTLLANDKNGIYINEFLASSIEKKPTFGHSGLSKNIWGIEKGEWSNYKMLYNTNKINTFTYIKAVSYSTLKFARRFLLTKLR